MEKVFLVVFCCSFLSLESSSVIKPRTVRGRDTTDIKKKIGKELDQILTLSSSLIASLSKQIDVVVKKIKQLVSGNDDFFSNKKAKELESYRQELHAIKTRLENTVEQTLQDLNKMTNKKLHT